MNSKISKKGIKTQSGAALVVGLILLLIITLLGYSSMRGTMLQEKMAAGLHNASLAHAGANSSLRNGESFLYKLVEQTNGVNVSGTPAGAFYNLFSYLNDPLDPESGVNTIIEEFTERNFDSSSGKAHDFDFMGLTHNGSLKQSPEYLIHELSYLNTFESSTEFGGVGGQDNQKSFVITGKSTSGDGKSYSLIQSLYTVVASSSPTN